MQTWQKRINKIKVIQNMASLKITVACLALLFVLTLWGTIAQVDQGLYLAQERYFFSWYFLVFGFLPFPGARAVLWFLFLNLLSVSLSRFDYRKRNMGILVIHIGLLTYFVSAFVTFHVTVESNISLMEGAGTNVSAAYHQWELSIWPKDGSDVREITAYDADSLESGDNIQYVSMDRQHKFELNVKHYFANAQAFGHKRGFSGLNVINDSGISRLNLIKREKEPEKNFPGLILDFTASDKSSKELLLYGAELKPTLLAIDNVEYYFQLRRKRYDLPFTIILDNFEMEVHPGTEIASKYQSFVTLDHDGAKRKAKIFMNNPLRFKDYTLYQASYAIDAMGREISTLAVVKNSGRLLPYISSGITFFGLVLHFLFMGYFRQKDNAKRNSINR